MMPSQILILSYIAFIWMVILHTFEEIACGIMEANIGPIHVTRSKYLMGASVISTLNLGVLVMMVLCLPAGYYLGLFTSGVIGVLQALIHGIDYLREGNKARNLGAGFYTSIPLAISGLIVFVQCVRLLTA